MSQGKENSSAFVEGGFGKIIIRIWGETHAYMGARQIGDIRNELAFMNVCKQQNIPVPKLYSSKNNTLYETQQGQTFAVMSYIEGASPHSFTLDMVRQVAKTMATMHLIGKDFSFPESRSWPGTTIEMTNDRIEQFQSSVKDSDIKSYLLLQQTIDTFETRLAHTNLSSIPQGVIHGDIMHENMKFDHGTLSGIFDFDDCRKSYFIEDITKTFLFDFESAKESLFGRDGLNVQYFLDEYQSVRKLSDSEKRALPMFFTARFLYQATVYAIKITQGRSEYQTKLDTLVDRYERHRQFFI
jgi:homoserine kinase type II